MEYDVVSKYDWCLNREGPEFLNSVPSLRLTAFKIEGNQQLQYLANILGGGPGSISTYVGLLEGGALGPLRGAAQNAIEIVKSGVGQAFSKITDSQNKEMSVDDYDKRESAYNALYELTNLGISLIVPYFTDTAMDVRNSWTEKVTTDATSLVGDFVDKTVNIASKAVIAGSAGIAEYFEKEIMGALNATSTGQAAKLTKNVASTLFGYKGVDDLTRTLIRGLAGADAPYSGVEQPMYYSSTSRGSIVINFPLYNIFDVSKAQSNAELVSKIAYWSVKNRTSYFSYESPYVFKVEDTSSFSTFCTRPLMYISDFKVKNIGTLRKVDLGGYTYTLPEAYSVSITLTDMLPISKNILEKSWTKSNFITVNGTSGVPGVATNGTPAPAQQVTRSVSSSPAPATSESRASAPAGTLAEDEGLNVSYDRRTDTFYRNGVPVPKR